MGIEEGVSGLGTSECGDGVQCLKRKAVSDEVLISNGNGVFEEGWKLKIEGVNDGDGISNGNGVAEEARHLESEAVNDGGVISNGNGVVEEIQCLESEGVNDEAVISNGNGVFEEIRRLESEGVNDGAVVSNGNGVAEEARRLESEAMSGGAVISNGNGVAVVAGVLKSEASRNSVAEEAGVLKSEAISNGVANSDGFDSGDGGSGGVTCLRTYKRRKYDRSCSKGKAQEDCRKCEETASDIADQVVKEPSDATLGNSADDYADGHWGNVVLKHLYQSLGIANCGIEGCIGEALIHHPQRSCATTVMVTSKIDKDGPEFSSQIDHSSRRTQTEGNGHASVMQNGSSSESHSHGVTEMCQHMHMLCNILTSEKFNSLCKTLVENFQGLKPESVFDFSHVISRMKLKTYEKSPSLLLLDIQKVWRKLQNTCNKMFALSEGLYDLSATSYSEMVRISAQSTSEDEKQVESDEQTEECTTDKICCCSCCGERADGTDCLVCDSCEKVYHLSCLEPAVKEIPHKSWYCANCTTSGIGSPHENCVVCVRLNGKKTPKKIIGDESLPTNEETDDEFEENSNLRFEISRTESHNCRVCGNEVDVKGKKIKMCGHPYCASKLYHVRCLTSKQLYQYGYCWLCPSCICQVCFTNQDDERIVLCDGCDYAHHLYCMKPPLHSIPQEKWFCKKCDAGIKAISRAKKVYESNKPRTSKNVSKPNANNKNYCNSKCVEDSESIGGMDMLITAANSLIFDENLSET